MSDGGFQEDSAERALHKANDMIVQRVMNYDQKNDQDILVLARGDGTAMHDQVSDGLIAFNN
jgi:hypothetical protein